MEFHWLSTESQWSLTTSHDICIDFTGLTLKCYGISMKTYVIPWTCNGFSRNVNGLSWYSSEVWRDLMIFLSTSLGCQFNTIEFQWKLLQFDESELDFEGISMKFREVSVKFEEVPWKFHRTPRVPPERSPGAPGSWGSFLSEPGPHAVLLRFIKPFELLARRWFSSNFHAIPLIFIGFPWNFNGFPWNFSDFWRHLMIFPSTLVVWHWIVMEFQWQPM